MSPLAICGGNPVRPSGKPFPAWPEVDASDEQAVLEVVRSGKWWMYAYEAGELASDTDSSSEEEAAEAHGRDARGTHGRGGHATGSRVEAFEREFARFQHVRHALATASGSGALEMACRAIGLAPGDEVITTPYTFIASSSCILNAGALPVFVDIEPDTYNLAPALVEAAVTQRTVAILPVHFGGNIADMTALRRIADKRGLKIIEDAAQAQGASLSGGRFAGALGDVAIFSLQQSKLLTCGEGGVCTTASDELAEAAWGLRHCGRTKTSLWYEHHHLGWQYRMTELQGALLLSQLRKLPAQNARRARNAEVLFAELAGLPGVVPCRQNAEAQDKVYYLLILRYDARAWDGLPREKLLAALAAEGIPAGGGYSFPLYENPLFGNVDFNGAKSPFRIGRPDGERIDFGRYRGACPVAERACRQEGIWLNHNLLLGSEGDAKDVARAFQKVYENRKELM
jgi:dTDP-4-amino-4,6-dideoxygalactose transaminase